MSISSDSFSGISESSSSPNPVPLSDLRTRRLLLEQTFCKVETLRNAWQKTSSEREQTAEKLAALLKEAEEQKALLQGSPCPDSESVSYLVRLFESIEETNKKHISLCDKEMTLLSLL